MLIIKSSIFNYNAQAFYKKLKHTKALLHIARPIIRFKQLKDYPLPEIWKSGKYPVLMRIFGFIPFGLRWIVVTTDTDDVNLHVRDNRYSKIIKKWDHNIYLKAIKPYILM